MTVLVPIDPDAPPEAGPSRAAAASFAEQEPDGDAPDLATVVRRIRGARRIVVVCGAGVSTAAAIPDFRSASGLFSGSRGQSVKDLFHVKSLSSAALLADHHALLTDLTERARLAKPTPFHGLLAALDSDGRLLRCYTQNIDGLEGKAGLRTGLPPPRTRSSSVRKGKQRSGTDSGTATPSGSCTPALGDIGDTLNPTPPTHPPAPRCIPLHGLLDKLHCNMCKDTVPIVERLPLPADPIPCPTCEQDSSFRSALSERSRRVGTLRASVVLYGEEHPEGELIGSVVERDLKGSGRRGEKEGKADLLIVAGTSLSIPGVKRIVKEMARALEFRGDGVVRDGKAPPIRTIYVNDEPPAKPAEWEDVFDVWAQGDVQQLSELVGDQFFAPPVTPRKSTPRTPRKKSENVFPPTPESITPTKPKKRKAAAEEEVTPTKRGKRASSTPTKRKPSASSSPTKRKASTSSTPTKRPKSETTSGATTPAKLVPVVEVCLPTPRHTPPPKQELDQGRKSAIALSRETHTFYRSPRSPSPSDDKGTRASESLSPLSAWDSQRSMSPSPPPCPRGMLSLSDLAG